MTKKRKPGGPTAAPVAQEPTARNPVTVDITNVAHWFYESNSQEDYDLFRDFPCIACPWPAAAFQFTMPRYSNSEGELIRLPRGIAYTCVILSEDLGADWRGAVESYPFVATAEQRASILSLLERSSTSPRFMQTWFFAAVQSGHRIPMTGMTLFVAEDGRPVTDKIPSVFALPGSPLSAEERVVNYTNSIAFPVAFALSLMHCRNVQVRDRAVSRQMRRRAERTGEPVTTYKELTIDALRSQVRQETAAGGEEQVRRALHICRGHFATYNEAAPLFGRFVGTVWKPMHVRGRQEAGEVRKGYKVK